MREPQNIAAALALAQASSRPPEPVRPLASGTAYAASLREGSQFYHTGRILGEDEFFMIIELELVTVLRDDGIRDGLDVFGRDLRAFWCRRESTGGEGCCTFGPRGVVRTEPAPPYFVLSPHAEQARQDAADLARWEADGGA
jgi:hypothetical protein